MSLSGPNSDFYKNRLLRNLDQLASCTTKSSADTNTKNVIDLNIESIKRDLIRQAELNEHAVSRKFSDISLLFELAVVHTEPRAQVKALAASSLEYLHAYSEMNKKVRADQPSGIEENLSESWAFDCFLNLLEEEDPWAVELFKKKLEESSQDAFEAFFELYTLCPHLQAFEMEVSLKGEFKEFIRQKLNEFATSSKEASTHFCTTIDRLLQSEVNHWIYGEIELALSQNETSIQLPKLLLFLFDQGKEHRPLFPFVKESIFLKRFWSLNLLKLCVKTPTFNTSAEFNSFFKYLFDQSMNTALEDFVTLCSIIHGIFSRTSLSWHFSEYIKVFESQRQEHKICKTLSRRGVFWDEHLTELQEKGSLKWQQKPARLRQSLLHQLLMRERRLIGVLLNHYPEGFLVDSCYGEGFKSPKKIVMGHCRYYEKIIKEIGEIASTNGIAVFIQLTQDSPSSDLLYESRGSDEKAYEWLRDVFLPFKKSLRVNPWFDISDKINKSVIHTRIDELKKRIKDFKREGEHFSCMSSAALHGAPFFNFETLEFLASQANTELMYNFLYLEGGNLLMGESYEGPYALVGEDTLFLNQILLKEHLKKLGLFKKEGQWEVSEKESTEEEVDIELVKKLLMIDLGLSKPEQITYVSQSTYHLDVSLSILDEKEKVVMINNSLMACDAMREVLQREDFDSLTQVSLATYEKRLESHEIHAERQHQLEKLAIEDLKEAGFKVVEVAGYTYEMYKSNPDLHPICYFNFLTFLNKEAEKEIIALGMPEYYKEKARAFYFEHIPNLRKVHFVDLKQSQEMLQYASAGLHCMSHFM